MSIKRDETLLQVNVEQCRAVGRHLKSLQVRPDPYLKRPASLAERFTWANYWLYITAICQSTRTFQGTLDGRWVRGWDYLVQASLRRREDFTAERMLAYTANDLRALLSDDGDPAHSPIDRVDERLGQLHDCAAYLLNGYAGEAMSLYERSAGRMAGPGGLLELLAGMPAFADPLRKKSVLLLGMLYEVGIWPLNDPEHLKVAMDYHAMRVALRSGMVEVTQSRLAEDLRRREPISDEVNQAVREAVSTACDIVVADSGLSVYAFDKLIWHLGRSCCFYEHAPICGLERAGQPCPKREACSFLRATSYACPDACVLDGVCQGSRTAAYRALWETNVYTADY